VLGTIEGIEPGAVLGTIEGIEPGADLAAGEQAAAPPPAASSTAVTSESAVEGSAVEVDVLRVSTPLARRAAAERGLDLGELEGSGPGGRVVEADVLRASGGAAERAEPVETAPEEIESTSPVRPEAAGTSSDESAGATVEASPPASGAPPQPELSTPFEARRLSAMRKTIARRLSESKQQVPHFYLRMRCAMDAVLDARARVNAGLEQEGRDTRISVNDFILRASALALREVPEANVQFAGKKMHFFERVDVSVAVATEGGLVTPVIREADRKGLAALSDEVKALAALAREGKLMPDQYQGGTFTISNLGMYGIETVYPIINLPQACILGVGAIEEQPVVRDGEIVIGRIAAITLAADHRAVDGAVGARLMAALRDRLEDPLGMVL
jgi:pyruvate dehydrogenase E2 component (dihydrolipoamide acetyltransferase)